MNKNILDKEYGKLFESLKERVAFSRYKSAIILNRGLILLYPHISTENYGKEASLFEEEFV